MLCKDLKKINPSKEASLIIFVDNIPDFIKKTNSMEIRVVSEFPFIGAVGIMANIETLKYLTKLREVKYISAQSKVTALDGKVGLDVYESRLNITNTEIQNTQSKVRLSTGLGVGVAILDTGINPHLDISLPNRVVEFVDFEEDKKFPYDDNGHGTFVAGICAGNGLCSGGDIIGSAPKCSLIGLKVMNANGEGGAFKVLEGMQWVIDNAKKYNIKVCCMSLGSEVITPNDPLIVGSEVLIKNNINVVCASGNSGLNTIKSPAAGLRVISVGSVGENYKISEFSSRMIVNGFIRPDFYAKGENVRGISGNAYGSMSGTSAAAPFVAGICAKVCEKLPNITSRDMKRILYKIAKRVGNIYVLDNDSLDF